MKRLPICWILVFWTIFCLAQENQGLRSNPASGIYGIKLNPAGSAFFPYSYQINGLSAHSFIENNYMGLSNTSFVGLWSEIDDLDIATHPSRINRSGNQTQLVFNEENQKITGAMQSSIMWPSALWQKDDATHLGIIAQTRIVGSIYNAPRDLNYYQAAAISFDPTVIGPFSTSYLSWTEIGAHLSKKLVEDNYETSVAGATAHLILPHETARFELLDNVVANRQDSLYTAEGLVSSSQYTVFTESGFKPRVTGVGLSVDLGYMTATDQYSYGFSLLDFGFTLISSGAQSYNLVSDTTIFYNNSGIVDPGDLDEVLTDVDDQLDPQISRQVDDDGGFVVGLPTALSFQYHRKINEKTQLSFLLTQRVPVFKNAVRRPNTFALIPQYGVNHLHISAPISLFEYRELSFGLNLRYYFFFIGTDNLLSFFKQSRFTGTDVSVGIQYYPFKQNETIKDVRCFKF